MYIFLNCMFKITSENKDRISLGTEEYVALCVSDHFALLSHYSIYTVREGLPGYWALVQYSNLVIFCALFCYHSSCTLAVESDVQMLATS